jgi:hypothetical protein
LPIFAAHRAQLGAGRHHLPTALAALQLQIEHPQVIAPAPRHQRRHAMDQAANAVDPRLATAGAAGELAMLVAEQQRVDAGDLSEQLAGLLGVAADAGMGDDDDQIGALAAQPRHPLIGRLEQALGAQRATELGAVP